MEAATNDTKQNLDEDFIRERAYRLWLEDGQPEGRADEHWHKARADALASMSETGPSVSETDEKNS